MVALRSIVHYKLEMPAKKKGPGVAVSENVSARITHGEREVLERLCKLRAADMEKMSMPGDDTFAGWLRWMIRKEAKEAGIPIVVAEPEPPRAKQKAQPKTKGRK